MTRLAALAALLVSAAPLACRDRAEPADAGAAVDAQTVAVKLADASALDAASVSPWTVVTDAATSAQLDAGASRDAGSFDAGASACKRIYGPARQPFDGPAAMAVRGDRLELVTNDRGKPQITTVTIPASLTAVVPPSLAEPAHLRDTVHPPCAIAGETVYCVGPGNILTRFPRDGAGAPKEVATVISVRGIAAAPLGSGHDVVAFHQQRKTTEGFVSEGWISLDGQTPERLSEEGSGATALDLAVAPPSSGAPPGASPEVIALSLDARVAMTPMHARHVGLEADHARLHLGTDEVVFIGPLAEPGTVPRLATSRSAAYALAAWPREAADFGLSVVALPEALRIDLPAVWSLYRNGLDPAPLAATRGSDPVAVARIVPAGRELPTDPKRELVLELGTLAPDGAFLSAGEVARGRRLADLSITRDDKGAVWLLWSDNDGTWLERRVCP